MVRGLPGEVALPEEQPDWGDKDGDSVPLPLLAGRQHPHLHQGNPGVQTVSSVSVSVTLTVVVDVVTLSVIISHLVGENF